jgi:ATP-dependent Clp protease ATP-binding subunit ClpC
MPPRRRRRLLRRRRCYNGPPTGHIPFTPRAKKCLERSLREALARHDHYIGVEHLTLALAGMTDGIAPRILDRLGVTPALTRAAIVNRYRKAG